MKLLASLLIIVSLCVGLVSAITAYVPRLDSFDPSDNLTLNAPAGATTTTPPVPVFEPTTTNEIRLTVERIEQLKQAGVRRVRVKEFSFSRWEHRWWFVASCTGLLVGAGMLRSGRRSARDDQGAGVGISRKSPRAMLHAARTATARLTDEAPGAFSAQLACGLVMQRVDAIQRDHLQPFMEQRQTVIGRLGISGYARMMDRAAAAERWLNRAWSAAADEALDEAVTSLRTAISALDEAIAVLPDE